MLLSFDGNIDEYGNFFKYEDENFEVFWQGIIFCRKLKAGKESIKSILKNYVIKGEIDFNSIFGAYIIIILNKKEKKKLIFTDNSKMRSFYIGRKYISDSFLILTKKEPYLSYNKEGLTQFLTLGTVFFEKTIYNEITLSKSEIFYVISSEGDIKKYNKLLNKIDDSNDLINIKNFFKDASYAIKDLSVSFDITGGFDSRMVLVAMEKYLKNYGLFISGPKEAKDVLIGKKVANTLGKDINHFNINMNSFSEKDLEDLFYYTDGCSTLLDYIRESKLNVYRKKLKYNVRITGDGGVLHKDWWWIQDIPFYKKKIKEKDLEAFLTRFYYQRIEFLNLSPNILSNKLQTVFDQQKSEFIKNCIPFCKNINSQTYDMLYFYVSGSKRSLNYNFGAKHLDWYAPLWERELVRYSYNLPRLKRFNNNYQKDIITEMNLKISKLRTYYRITACSKLIYKVCDFPLYIVNIFERALLMFRRKIFNTNKKSDVDTFSPTKEVKKMDVFLKAICYAKEKNVLSPNLDISKLSGAIIDSLINIYMGAKYTEKNIEISEDKGE